MFNIKEAKKRARKNVKKHYAIFLVACLIASILGVAYTSSVSTIKARTVENVFDAVDITSNNKSISIEEVVKDALEYVKDNKVKEIEPKQLGIIEVGTSSGVFSIIVNRFFGGKGLLIVLETIDSALSSNNFVLTGFIVFTGLALLALTIFLKLTYRVAFKRIFLESYQYDVIKPDRFVYLFKVKKAVKASFTIFVLDLYQFLWNLTIVGGIIKMYDYKMVPYIVSENPNINRKEAILLSKRMMYGHRLEAFYLDLSFLGWGILSTVTAGLSSLLYSSQYREAVMVEYYAHLRSIAKQRNISYSNNLNDIYLFEKANDDVMEKEYSDVVDALIDDVDIRDLRNDGFRGFIENNFGLIYRYDEKEDLYNTAIEQEEKIEEYKNVLDNKQYPSRLSPLKETRKDSKLESYHYLRHYSLWNIVLMFFIFCFVGWAWEVVLHLVTDGEFVNRGVLHGPWLPIYGSGCFFILTLLFRFRNKPKLEATMIALLCGVVEYSTAWFLETFKGVKWWDYSGFFLNIQGRVCAEGLLIFMLGGLAVTYILGPIIDNKLRKIKRFIIIPLCILLLSSFAYDLFYSYKNPNMGKGITTEIIEINDNQ